SGSPARHRRGIPPAEGARLFHATDFRRSAPTWLAKFAPEQWGPARSFAVGGVHRLRADVDLDFPRTFRTHTGTLHAAGDGSVFILFLRRDPVGDLHGDGTVHTAA